MMCERCGNIGETFMTEGHGELCEACQRDMQTRERPQARSRPSRPSDE
jgi:hypothetical protein